MLDTKTSNGHSLISPSGASRWTACPASVRLGMTYEDSTNSAAQRGTDIHQLGEIMLRTGAEIPVGTSVTRDYEKSMFWANSDMVEEAKDYYDYVQALATDPDAEIIAEAKVDIIPEYDVSGHIDATVINGDTLHIVDLKTGRGAVSAEGNLQMQLYALGTLDEHSMFYDFEKVVLHIVQDNASIHNTNSWETTPEDLEDFREWATERARLALQEDSECVASETACQWCPHASHCEALSGIVVDAFADLDEVGVTDAESAIGASTLLNMEQIATFMEKRALIDMAFKAYESRIGDELKAGNAVKGFKLIKATTRKKWSNEIDAYDKLKSWLPLDEVAPRKLATPTQVEKMLGKDISSRKKNIFGEMWEKPEGAIKCVPESAQGKALELTDITTMFEEL